MIAAHLPAAVSNASGSSVNKTAAMIPQLCSVSHMDDGAFKSNKRSFAFSVHIALPNRDKNRLVSLLSVVKALTK